MKNILMLTPFYPPNLGGAETFTEGLVKEAIKCHKVTVLTFQPFKQKSEKFYSQPNLEIYRMNWLLKQSGAWKGVSLRNILSVIPQLALKSFLLCLRNKYDIIHAQGLLSGFVTVLLKKVFKTKAYMTLLALYKFSEWRGIKRAATNFIFRNCDMIFVEGQNGMNDLCGMDWVSIKPFYHWCDQSIFCPPSERPTDNFRVLFIGRPIPEKGKHIIEQVEKYLAFDKRFEFTYVENVPHSELPKLYQNHHVVVVPSLYAEGFTRVVAEAACCGCAVITSDKGSLPEMVEEFGLSIDPTVEKFVYWIKATDTEMFGKKSFRFAKENFSPKNAEVFLNEYANN